MVDNSENTNDNLLSVLIDGDSKNNTAFFTINSQKASEILGINRTRLSQLTSQGIFPYERRKVDARSRLFYRLNDLLNYQRKSSFGNLPTQEMTVQNQALIPLLPPATTLNSTSITPTAIPQNYSQANFSKIQKPPKTPRILQKALDLKILQEERMQNAKLTVTIAGLEKKLNKIEGIIENLERALLKLSTHKLSRKKCVFHRPSSKRTFKLLKR